MNALAVHTVLLALMPQATQLCLGVKRRQPRLRAKAIHPDLNAENGIQYEVRECSARNTAPLIHVGHIVRTLERSTLHGRPHIFYKVRLPDWPLVAGLSYLAQPACHFLLRLAELVQRLGRHRRPGSISPNRAMVGANVPCDIRVSGGKRAHPLARSKLRPEECRHLPLLLRTQLCSHTV